MGKGSFGQVFAGRGEGGTRVAIKQFSKSPEGSVDAAEVERNVAWAPASPQVILVLLLGGGGVFGQSHALVRRWPWIARPCVDPGIHNVRTGPPEPLISLCVALECVGARTFAEEACRADLLRHPSLVRLLDVYFAEDSVHLVYEFAGTDLSCLCKSMCPRRLEPVQLRMCIGQLFAGLTHVHAKGLVHTDVKPANIFVRSSTPWDCVLGDLGSCVEVCRPACLEPPPPSIFSIA